MTWARWTRLVLSTAAFVFLGWHAAAAFFAHVWTYAALLYALALVFAAAIWREWQTAASYADAVDDGQPTEPTSRGHARVLARRVLAGTCRCDRWWTSLGTDHDPWCPVQAGTSHAARPHRPLPRRRAAPPTRRRRRQRPR